MTGGNRKKVLITAGPTHEAIDPVRFIGNYSTGKMGYAIADAFAGAGYEVLLISGPTSVSPSNKSVRVIRVDTASEMYEACLKEIDGIDVAVFSAAVADYTPLKKADRKIKRTGEEMLLRLIPTKDIAAEMGKLKKAGQIFVGFALETEEGVEQAKSKLERKNLDLIVLNSLKDKGAGFGTDTNKVALIDKSGNIDNFEVKPKKEVAFDILDKTEKLMGNA